MVWPRVPEMPDTELINAAAALSGHRQRERLQDVVKAPEINGENLIPILRRHAGQGAVAVDAGIQNNAPIDAVGFNIGGECGSCSRAVGDIKKERSGCGIEFAKFGEKCVGFCRGLSAVNDDIVAVSSQTKRRCAADAAGAARNEHGAAIRLCSKRHHFLIGVFSNTEAGILASAVMEALEISGRRIEDIERCRPRRDAAGDAARPLNQHDFAVKLPESFIAFKFLFNSAE